MQKKERVQQLIFWPNVKFDSKKDYEKKYKSFIEKEIRKINSEIVRLLK